MKQNATLRYFPRHFHALDSEASFRDAAVELKPLVQTLVHISVWNHEPGPKVVHLGLDRNLAACAFGCPSPCSVADVPCDLDLRSLSSGTKGFWHRAAAVEAPQQQRPVAGHAPRGAALPVWDLSRQRPGGVPATGGRET